MPQQGDWYSALLSSSSSESLIAQNVSLIHNSSFEMHSGWSQLKFMIREKRGKERLKEGERKRVGERGKRERNIERRGWRKGK